jgi:hypothetical protein
LTCVRPTTGEELRRRNGSWCHQGLLMRREALAIVGEFSTRLIVAADYDLMLRGYRDLSSPLPLPFPVARFRMGGLSEIRGGRRELEKAYSRTRLLNRPIWESVPDLALAARRASRS